MSSRAIPATEAEQAQNELLAQLGLPVSASPEDVDNLHEAVTDYLAAAPSSIRGWARAQAAALDAAYLSLTDPVGLEGSALRSPTRPPTVVPGGPATPPARRDFDPAPVTALTAAITADDLLEEEEVAWPDDGIPELDTESGAADDAEALAALYASVTPSAHEDMAPSKAPPSARSKPRATRSSQAAAATAAPLATSPASAPNAWKRLVLGGVAVLVLVGAVVGVNAVVNPGPGDANGSSDGAAQAQPTAPAVDTAKVAGLMATYQANPEDIPTLIALGTEFYLGGEYDTAGDWFDKALAVDPNSVEALLGRGAVYFNQGDNEGAARVFNQVVVLEPDNQEAYYDLGFIALNQAEPDWAVVQSNWNKVIELDPTSALAQNVQQHLTALADASMLPGSSGAPASSAAPAASPAGAVPSVAPGSTVLQQTAQNVQFGVGTLSAPANTPFTIHFANNDNDVQHDIVITDPAGTPVFTGALIDGGTATDYQVGALPAGTYTFKCSLHPVMTGTLTVGP